MTQPKRIKHIPGKKLPHRATCVTDRAWSNPFDTVAEFEAMMAEIHRAKGEISATRPHMHHMLFIYKNLHLLRGFDLAGADALDVESHVDVLLAFSNKNLQLNNQVFSPKQEN